MKIFLKDWIIKIELGISLKPKNMTNDVGTWAAGFVFKDKNLKLSTTQWK